MAENNTISFHTKTLNKPKTKKIPSTRLKAFENWYRQSWSDVFREEFTLTQAISLFDDLLGWLSQRQDKGRQRYSPLNIHKLEKDLVYLNALVIEKKAHIFLSFPISPVSLGILMVAYYALLGKGHRSRLSTENKFSSKSFIIWIRPRDNGKIKRLTIVKSNSEKLKIGDELLCLPSYRIGEYDKRDKRLKVIMVRSLAEGEELLKQSQFCSLVVIDDPAGRTHPIPSNYGDQAFEISRLCKYKSIPMIGIIPPWALRSIEYAENKKRNGTLIWAIDSAALGSYSIFPSPFAKNENPHPVESSYNLLNRKNLLNVNTKITIKTFSLNADANQKLASAFQDISDLLIDISKRPELKKSGVIAWNIWHDLVAPILPFYLLWEFSLIHSLQRLKALAQKKNEPIVSELYVALNSLCKRLSKISINPFFQAIKNLEADTTLAISDMKHADAVKDFLLAQGNPLKFKLITLRDLQYQEGKKLVILGQPKSRYRSLLLTNFFHEVDVLLWDVLADRAEIWWQDLAIDSRAWHSKSWFSLTGQVFSGRYEYSLNSSSVQRIHVGEAKLSRLCRIVDLAQMEESFTSISNSTMDSAVDTSTNYLSSYYLIQFEKSLGMRVAPNSEFLVLMSNSTAVASVKEITVGTQLVLFDGMNRDELFVQKAGLLDETKDNWLYQVQLEGWREIVKKRIEELDLWLISRQIFDDTGIEISETAIRTWADGKDLLTLPREEEHFFWFMPSKARQGLTEFWHKANVLRDKRRQLGRVISACAQEGWKDRDPEEIVFQYQQIFITVDEIKDAMQVVQVQSVPQFIQQKPEYPINRLFHTGG